MASTAKISTGIYHPPKPGPALDATIPVSGSCVLDKSENCVGGPGIRKLLRFDVLVHNEGNQDLVLGDPAKLPNLFVFSPCHHHYHFKGAALYELLDASGTKQVVKGRKQGFCIEDTLPTDATNHPPNKYTCQNQGIQVGWADWYPSVLDCQWIDITDVPPGDYKLHVFWNPQHLIPETTLDDNQAFAPINIPADTDPAPIVKNLQVGAPRQLIVADSRVTISWSAEAPHGVVTQEVWFSKDDGATWKELIGDLPGTSSSYTWTIGRSDATTAGRIRIIARDGNAQAGRLVSETIHVNPAKLPLPKVRERR